MIRKAFLQRQNHQFVRLHLLLWAVAPRFLFKVSYDSLSDYYPGLFFFSFHCVTLHADLYDFSYINFTLTTLNYQLLLLYLGPTSVWFRYSTTSNAEPPRGALLFPPKTSSPIIVITTTSSLTCSFSSCSLQKHFCLLPTPFQYFNR